MILYNKINNNKESIRRIIKKISETKNVKF